MDDTIKTAIIPAHPGFYRLRALYPDGVEYGRTPIIAWSVDQIGNEAWVFPVTPMGGKENRGGTDGVLYPDGRVTSKGTRFENAEAWHVWAQASIADVRAQRRETEAADA